MELIFKVVWFFLVMFSILDKEKKQQKKKIDWSKVGDFLYGWDLRKQDKRSENKSKEKLFEVTDNRV